MPAQVVSTPERAVDVEPVPDVEPVSDVRTTAEPVPDVGPAADPPRIVGLTIAESLEIARREQERVVAPAPTAPAKPAPKPTYCQACRFEVATGVCEGCAKHLCDDHLIRTAGRGRRSGRTLCVQCGLVAAGVRRVGR